MAFREDGGGLSGGIYFSVCLLFAAADPGFFILRNDTKFHLAINTFKEGKKRPADFTRKPGLDHQKRRPPDPQKLRGAWTAAPGPGGTAEAPRSAALPTSWGGAGPKAQGPEGPEVRRQPALGAEEGHRSLRHLEMGSRDF